MRWLIVAGVLALGVAGCTNYQEQEKDVSADISSGKLSGEALARAHVEHGRLLAASGDLDGAMTDLDAAVAAAPALAVAYAFRAEVKFARSDIDGAFADYDQAIAFSAADDPSGYLMRGHAYNEHGDYQRAAADYDQAIKREKVWPAFAGHGIALAQLGEDDRAFADLTEGLKEPWQRVFLFPRKTPFSMGAAHGEQIEGYLFNAAPLVASARFARGKILLKRDAYDDAVDDFDSAISKAGSFPQAEIYRGLAKLGRGDCAAGMEDVRAGAALATTTAEAVMQEHHAFVAGTKCGGRAT